MRWKSVAVLLALTTALVAGLAPSSGATPPPFPDSMAAIGDSITRATDVCCFYGDHPRKSWNTGSASDSIVSHYERILAVNPGMASHGHNDARSGAKMADAAGQASAAVGQQAEYVMILLGQTTPARARQRG
jgi:hypothetical protein